MKKIFALATLLVAALALTNCSKEETVTPAVEKNFTVYADLGETRTIADGYATSWESGDAMNIWHAVAGETTYTHDGEFTLTDAELGAFDGTVTGVEEGTSYDWFAFYPYTSYNSSKTPAYTAYYAIAAQTQEQTGDNNTAHTSGAPLYGVVKGGSSAAPEFSMKHLSTMIKFNVTNIVDEAISIKSIAVATESSKITGTFHVDMTGEAPAYTSSGDYYTYTTATLNVTEGGDLAAEGGSAAYYMTLCPFTAAEGEKLTVTVTNNGDEVCERTYTLNGKTFNPGKVTTLNFDFEANTETEWTTIAEIHAAEAEGTFNIQNATVVAVAKYNSLLTDGTGYLFSYQDLGVAVGDVINITGALTSTYGERQIKSGATVEKIGTTTVEHPTPEVIADATAFNSLVSNYTVGQYVTIDASKVTTGDHLNFYVNGGSATGSFVTPSDTSELVALNGLPAKITGYVCYLNTSNFLYVFMTDIEAVPYLIADTTSLTWSATDTTAQTATIKSDVEGWTVQSAPEWVSAVYTDASTLTVTPQENTAAEERSGVVVLKHATEAITAEVAVSQTAAGEVAPVTASFVCNSDTFPYTGTGATGIMTATDGTISVVLAKGTSTTNVNSNYYSPIRMYKSHTLTFSGAKIKKIVITCSGSSYAGLLTVKTGTGTITTSGTTETYTCDGDSEVVFSNTAQVRISKIEVTYVVE